MDLIGFKESSYIKKHLSEVKHITLNPDGPGVVRLHLIPPVKSLKKDVPAVIIINGSEIIPVSISWAILISSFIDELHSVGHNDITEEEWEKAFDATTASVEKVYPRISSEVFRRDIERMLNAFVAFARVKIPEEDIGNISLGEYSRYMTAPHRMDLMISAMTKNNKWNCNQKCVNCYAEGQPVAETPELSTDDWKKAIDICKKAGISQLTFTGGEPTLRNDLTELIKYSEWFITRLNTNGVLLTEELCKNLKEASLDSVQVTLYSADAEVHNKLVGANNFDKTVIGIKNCVAAGLDISINTPLCVLNEDFVKLLEFAKELGVKFISCSGLIVTGGAAKESSGETFLSQEKLCLILKEAFEYCRVNDIEITFTSPGWVDELKLREIGFTSAPSCGACLSNMAIAPDGSVVPCQSWLSEKPLGNILTDKWSTIWNSKRCKDIRSISARNEHKCQLRKKDGKGETRCL